MGECGYQDWQAGMDECVSACWRTQEEAVTVSEKPCPECGCIPSDAWGCECSNEDCPCSEEVDDEDVWRYPAPQGEQAQRDIGY